MTEQKYVLHYWGIRARNWPILLAAAVGGVELEWNRNPQAEYYKEHSPFGQLPLLTGPNGFTLGQSMAITRFVGRKGGLLGESDIDFANSETLIEESNDISGLYGKAQYGTDRKAAFDEVFTTSLPKHLANLEKSADRFFNASKLNLGQISLFAVLNIGSNLDEGFLKAYPKVQAWYNEVAANPKINAIISDATIGHYYQRQ